MRTFGRNTVIGAIGLAMATLAVAPAWADDGRHGGGAERAYGHDRRAHHDWRHDVRRFAPGKGVVYHRGGRTVIVVPERRYRAAIRHRHHPDPVVRRLLAPLFW